MESYLQKRKQIVVVNGIKSDILDVKAGVPQGSRLGPLLFLIYMNGITQDIESCQNPTQLNSTQLNATLKQLALELDTVVTCSKPFPRINPYQSFWDKNSFKTTNNNSTQF